MLHDLPSLRPVAYFSILACRSAILEDRREITGCAREIGSLLPGETPSGIDALFRVIVIGWGFAVFPAANTLSVRSQVLPCRSVLSRRHVR